MLRARWDSIHRSIGCARISFHPEVSRWIGGEGRPLARGRLSSSRAPPSPAPLWHCSCYQTTGPLRSLGPTVWPIRRKKRQSLLYKPDTTISNPLAARFRGVRCAGSLGTSGTIRPNAGFPGYSRSLGWSRWPTHVSVLDRFRTAPRHSTRNFGFEPGRRPGSGASIPGVAGHTATFAIRTRATRSLGGPVRPSPCIRYRGMHFIVNTISVRRDDTLPPVTCAADLAIGGLAHASNRLASVRPATDHARYPPRCVIPPAPAHGGGQSIGLG